MGLTSDMCCACVENNVAVAEYAPLPVSSDVLMSDHFE